MSSSASVSVCWPCSHCIAACLGAASTHAGDLFPIGRKAMRAARAHGLGQAKIEVSREMSFLLRLSGFRHAIARVACAAPTVVLWSLRVRVHALGTADKRGRKETLGVYVYRKHRPQRRSGPMAMSGDRFFFTLLFSMTASCDDYSDETHRSHSRLETVVCADMR